MVRVVIWLGHAGKGFGPVGALLGTLLVAGAGYALGTATKTKTKKKGWL